MPFDFFRMPFDFFQIPFEHHSPARQILSLASDASRPVQMPFDFFRMPFDFFQIPFEHHSQVCWNVFFERDAPHLVQMPFGGADLSLARQHSGSPFLVRANTKTPHWTQRRQPELREIWFEVVLPLLSTTLKTAPTVFFSSARRVPARTFDQHRHGPTVGVCAKVPMYTCTAVGPDVT